MTREEIYRLKPGDLLEVINYGAPLYPRYALVVAGTGPDVVLAWKRHDWRITFLDPGLQAGPSSSQWLTIDFDRLSSVLQRTRLKRIA
jgi:hypothetical protein